MGLGGRKILYISSIRTTLKLFGTSSIRKIVDGRKAFLVRAIKDNFRHNAINIYNETIN